MDVTFAIVLGSASFGALSALVAQVSTNTTVQQWASVGSMTAVVGVLVMVAKLLVSGDLVSRKTADVEKEMRGLNERLLDVIERFEGFVEHRVEEDAHNRLLLRESHQREMEYIKLFREVPNYEQHD